MDVNKRNALLKEAEMQSAALKRLAVWRTSALCLFGSGSAVTYAGFFGSSGNLFLKTGGIILMILGFTGAAVINLGIKNGTRNVEKILKAAEEA